METILFRGRCSRIKLSDQTALLVSVGGHSVVAARFLANCARMACLCPHDENRCESHVIRRVVNDRRRGSNALFLRSAVVKNTLEGN